MIGGSRRDALWAQLGLGVPYPERPPLWNDEEVLNFGLEWTEDKHEFMAESLSHRSDVLPPSRAGLVAQIQPSFPQGRVGPKLFHRLGSCARVALRIDPDSPYTGLLGPGPPVAGLCRASLANGSRDAYSPGVAFKWFPDAGPSINVLTSQGFDGFAPSLGFFGRPFPTAIEPPTVGFWAAVPAKAVAHGLAGVFQGALVWWRNRAEPVPPDPLRVDLTEIAAVDRAGDRVADPIAPRTLVFEPVGDAPPPRDDFRDQLAEVLPGPLFTLRDPLGRAIGQVGLESPFTASAGGDELLFFRHPFPE